MTLLHILLVLLTLPLLAVSTVFLFEVLSSFKSVDKSDNHPITNTYSTVILIPAHNEEAVIEQTIHSAMKQLGKQDQIVVVADNCNDTTADISRKLGATVVERNDSERRGKGFALDYGVRFIESIKPDVVVVLDADCILSENSLTRLIDQCSSSDRPAQACYLMNSPTGAGPMLRVAQFAWVVKNYVRPRGLWVHGFPCQLMGTGMAFPWSLISSLELASGSIVEDMEMGIALAEQGKAPGFCPDAVVTSEFPTDQVGVSHQRRRWEHGHLNVIVQKVPGLLVRSVKTANRNLALLAVDLLVPPLALLAGMILVAVALSMLFLFLANQFTPLIISSIAFIMIFLGTAMAWLIHGRDILSLQELMTAPLYILKKVPLYIGFFRNKQEKWVRTSRDK